MNYYEHHLGDYAAATAHLSWDEDMAYTRLLRAYYHHERAIREGEQYRLARAQTKPQRAAVDIVLKEFFIPSDGVWRQKRADSEIARFQDKQAKAKRSADARWSHSERNANASPNAMRTDMRTHSEGNAPRHQTPDTSNQLELEKITDAEASVVPGKPVTPICPQSEIVSIYHDVLPSLTRVRDWTPERQAFLRKRWTEDAERQTIDWWRNFFEYVGRCDFLMGRSGGNRPFACDLEWLVRPKNFVKVLEGKYENRGATHVAEDEIFSGVL